MPFTAIRVAEVTEHDMGVVAVEVDDVAPAVAAPEEFDAIGTAAEVNRSSA